jgi:hypothetical protein
MKNAVICNLYTGHQRYGKTPANILSIENGGGTFLRNVRFEVFKAVTMKNAVFWDIKSQFVLHRRHITSPLQSSAG